MRHLRGWPEPGSMSSQRYRARAVGPSSLQFEGIDCGATVINAEDTGSCCGWSEIGLQSCTMTAVESISTHGTSLFWESSGSKQWFDLQGHSLFLIKLLAAPFAHQLLNSYINTLLDMCLTCKHAKVSPNQWSTVAPTQYFLIIPLLVIIYSLSCEISYLLFLIWRNGQHCSWKNYPSF